MCQQSSNNRNDTLLRVIYLLSDGKFYSRKQCHAILGIEYRLLDEIIKEINSLGIRVFLFREKGYRLDTPLSLLDENLIRNRSPVKKVSILPIVDSTNQYLIDHIGSIRSGEVCIAEYQTKGRGKIGRRWTSTFGKGLCLSIYWRYGIKKTKTSISLMVSIVLVEVLQKFGAKDIQIKWPNDLYVGDKKLAGILVEIINDNEDFFHLILGIGINVFMSSYEGMYRNRTDLQNIGISVDRNILAIKMIDAIYSALSRFERDGFIPFFHRWQQLNILHKKPIQISPIEKTQRC